MSSSPALETHRVHIRWMIRRDLPEVLAIEEGCSTDPWGEEDFLRCLRTRNCIGMAAEQGERVVGFMVYVLHKRTLELVRFAVHPAERHRRVGTQMVNKMKGKLSSHRRTELSVDVRETQLGEQLFFRAQGFRAVAVRRAWYDDTGEDAYALAYRLPEWREVCDDAEEGDPCGE